MLLVLQISIYSSGMCLLPFNSLQVTAAAGKEDPNSCSRSYFITIVSFLLDLICVQNLVASRAYVLSNGMGYAEY